MPECLNASKWIPIGIMEAGMHSSLASMKQFSPHPTDGQAVALGGLASKKASFRLGGQEIKPDYLEVHVAQILSLPWSLDIFRGTDSRRPTREGW